MQPCYRVIGIEASPYAVKVRAVFRYRRLPHIWVARMPQFLAETAEVRPLIMPVVQYPDGEYRTDSTPVILDLERRHPESRSVIPPDAGDAVLSALIEDMADEWLVKSLFHYRFDRPVDQQSGAIWVMDDSYPGIDSATLQARTDAFIERQVARKPLVGCTPENAHLFEAFFRELLAAMEGFVATDRFLFGSRPSLADFGLFGQLHTLSADPTSAAIVRTEAPRTLHWVRRLHDCSGVEGEWRAPSDAPPAILRQLLNLAGRYYLPFLSANAAAWRNGDAMVEAVVDGHPYRQPVFRYQMQCYDTLLRQYNALAADTRRCIDPVLHEAGCLRYLA
tara:strand:- start:152 stop:1156 length:1005 start_codon:yes stop_codon:yes gene_type:complete